MAGYPHFGFLAAMKTAVVDDGEEFQARQYHPQLIHNGERKTAALIKLNSFADFRLSSYCRRERMK